MTSRDVIFAGGGLSVIIAVSYGGGGVSDTQLRYSDSSNPGPAPRDD